MHVLSWQTKKRLDPKRTMATNTTKHRDVTAEGGGYLQRLSRAVSEGLEESFSILGRAIGTYPGLFIFGCVFVASLPAIGLMTFEEATDTTKLWVPEGSDVSKQHRWVYENYPNSTLVERFIAEGVDDNILTKYGINALLTKYLEMYDVNLSTDYSTLCVKAGEKCLVHSILELWSYDVEIIGSLNQSRILSDINSITKSPYYGRPIDLDYLLGNRTVDAYGQTIAAQAALMTFFMNGNETMINETKAWEEAFIGICFSGHFNLGKIYLDTSSTASSFDGKATKHDFIEMGIGYCIVIVFVIAVLGKFNTMEQRVWVAFGGFLCIGFSNLVSIGISSAFQQKYGPLETILPYLLLGIGVDDMFVIMGAYTNLPDSEKSVDIPTTMSNVMRHAGVSITVTSLTNFTAFMIGATSTIPALRSFCIHAGTGILALYLLDAMLFSSFLCLDLQREKGGRDGCCCCIKHTLPYTSNKCSKTQIIPYIFKMGLARIITHTAFKVTTLVVGVSLFSWNVYGLTQLKQYYNPDWFLPLDSYPAAFIEANNKYFPEAGASGHVYCGNIDYHSLNNEFDFLGELMARSKWNTEGSTDPWFSTFTDWLAASNTTVFDETTNITTYPILETVLDQIDNTTRYPLSETDFISLAHQMTIEQPTARTANYLRFDAAFTNITASRSPFRHHKVDDRLTEIEMMDSTRVLVSAAGFNGTECFPYAREYLTWETNKVIREESYRNLALTLGCVFLVTLLLIADFWTSCIVFIGVLFTLIDVAGSMYFWDLTIDTVTSILLIVSVGLSVDYCVHIGHFFMTIAGTRDERAKATVGEMGSSVFYGGLSTFLAYILLADGNIYVYKTFYKVNSLVVVYGLFHGLLFLPVLLSLMGPAPYHTASSVAADNAEVQDQKDNNGNDIEAVESKKEGKVPPVMSIPNLTTATVPTSAPTLRLKTFVTEQSKL